MKSGLQDLVDAMPELKTASINTKLKVLNADGSAEVEAWVVDDVGKNMIPKKTLLSGVAVSSKAKVYDMMKDPKDDFEKAFTLQYDSGEDFDMSHPEIRSMIDFLQTQSTITSDEATGIKRMGERKKSKAEEIFGTKLTLEDFKE